MRYKGYLGENLYIIQKHWLRLIFDLQYLTICRELKKLALTSSGKKLTILDFGAGIATYRRYFNSNSDYYTLDPNCPADFNQLSQIPESIRFDKILLIEVLEHLESPIDTLVALKARLTSKGEFIISVPLNARVHLCPTDYRRYSLNEIEKLATKSDLRIKKNIYRGGNWTTIANKLFYLATALGRKRKFMIVAIILLIPALISLILAHCLEWLGIKGDDPLGFFIIMEERAVTFAS